MTGRVEEEQAKVERQQMLAEARSTAGVVVSTRSDGNGADVSVENEPKVYGYGSANSYFADLYYTSVHSWQSPQFQAAFQRQLTWSAQVEHEIADGTRFGKQAEKQFREHYRSPQGDGSFPGAGPDWRGILTECRSRGRVGLSQQGIPEQRAITTGGGATASASGGGAAAFVTPIFTESDYVPYRQFGRTFTDECTKRPLPPYGMTIEQ